ncbi:hypothetical protein FRB98_001564 [Tulasnella sp. 332]|nr:hypothetical protein FRB98_001564 [Tulasnella sp. 332]
MNLSIDAPLSLFSLPFFYLNALLPITAKMHLMKKALGGVYPTTNPRSNLELCKKKGVPEDIIQKLERMQAAHQNGYENFCLISATILTANFCGIENRMINLYAAGMLVNRIIYNYVYVNGTTEIYGTARCNREHRLKDYRDAALTFYLHYWLAANFCGIEERTINLYAAGMLVNRIIYNYVYVHGTTNTYAMTRSVVHNVGLIASWYLMFVSAYHRNVRNV